MSVGESDGVMRHDRLGRCLRGTGSLGNMNRRRCIVQLTVQKDGQSITLLSSLRQRLGIINQVTNQASQQPHVLKPTLFPIPPLLMPYRHFTFEPHCFQSTTSAVLPLFKSSELNIPPGR